MNPGGRRVRVFLRLLGALALCTLLTAAGVWWWYHHRPLPAPRRAELFRGITYEREVLRVPRPVVVHVVTIDLGTPGLSFLVTPGNPGEERPLRARTTSRFLQEFGAQLAVNGDFFSPWWSSTPWDYYPHPGDPVKVQGFAASRGVVYSRGERGKRLPTLYLSRDNRASFQRPAAAVYNALSGDRMLLSAGRIQLHRAGYAADLHPRTAVALDCTRTRLLLVAADGRQPNYSEGMTLGELAAVLQRHGGWDAMNLDGGGSTTLAMRGRDGRVRLLNSPIDNRIPGRERPVAMHLGVFAP